MNVFYEEDGGFKVGSVMTDNDTSLQVEAPHGKRSKVKASVVLLRFEKPALADFMADAERMAGEIDVDFLWQCCSQDEFDYATLAQEYFGHAPSALESAATLIRLHGAPMYFYKKGRGHYKAAPEASLKAALSGLERKKREAALKLEYIDALTAGQLPPALAPLVKTLLYKPDKNTLEYKALDEAAGAQHLSHSHLLQRCGAIPSAHDYHYERFLFEHFPRGATHVESPIDAPAHDLPLADVAAFSIDDAATTEIDDAFSVSPRAAGGVRIGIHIAAPALGITPGSTAEAVARERLSTVYHPAGKITMLADTWINAYTLAEGRACPALSLYVDVNSSGEIAATETRVERVPIAENLRLDTLAPAFNTAALAGEIDHPRGRELRTLWDFARARGYERRRGAPEPTQRAEYNFTVDQGHISITPRERGSAIDTVVSELMIHANSTWGRMLSEAKVAALYRVQSAGKVRMSTAPAPHEGLGVAQYVWSTSPLRRYVDLVNQRQLIACANAQTPVYEARGEALLSAMRDFELAHDAYGEFQRQMERYWCLRWIEQEARATLAATVIRDDLVRFDVLPLVARLPSVPALPSDTPVEIAITKLDLLALTFHGEFVRRLDSAH